MSSPLKPQRGAFTDVRVVIHDKNTHAAKVQRTMTFAACAETSMLYDSPVI
jgi:hypothetical protein